jgi:hypothetical protein
VSSKREGDRDRDGDERSPEAPAPAPRASSGPAAAPEPASAAAPEPALEPGGSGSVDVALSGPMPAAESGSIDVALSESLFDRPAVSEAGAGAKPPGNEPSPSPSPAPSSSVPELGSAPIASGRVPSVATGSEPPKHPHLEAAKEAAKEALGAGVAKLGTGIGKLGTGITHLGERSHVPLVSAGVSAIGESLSTVGETLHDLPRVARTRRGRLLVRSTLLGFLLVFAWIAGIIALQVRGIDAPDFRPTAEQILSDLSKGGAAIEQVYEDASPRFHEVVRKDRFVDSMTDMNATIGRFIEISAINESLVTTGPTGRVGRVSLTVRYEKGKTRATVSLHWDQGRWKLLGVGVDVPAELKITKAQREERVQACKDPMDPKKCDLFVAANAILEQLRDGHADQVWEDATKVFQKQEEKSRFVMLQIENLATLGEYRRIIAVTEAKLYSSGSTGTFDILTEYTKSQGVRTIFSFYRRTRLDPWKLTSLKVVVPMPRADEPLGTAPETKPTDLAPAAPGSAGPGSGSAGPGSAGSGSAGSGGATPGTAAPGPASSPKPREVGSAAHRAGSATR